MTRISLFILSFVIALCAAAQVSFVAKAPKTVDAESQFRVQYVLSNAEGEDFSCGNFNDFDVLAGPSVSNFSSVQIVNGKASSEKSVTYTYILQPKKKGTFHLPAASVRVKGKVMKSQALTVNVTGGSSAGASRQNSRVQTDDEDDFFETQRAGSAVTQKDLFFTVSASKRQVYEQEPIMLTYMFHCKVGVGLANVMLRQKPDLKGFWTQEIELPRNLQPTTERINGSLYRVGKNLQYVIFPQQTGKLTVPGIMFDCDVVQRDNHIDPLDAFFNGGGNINVKVQRSTEDLGIEVLPLPQPKPVGFSGGVGHFDITSSLATPQPKTNDIATLRLVVKGAGNMKLIKAPVIKFPKDFDTYDAKMTDHTKVTMDGITGEVYFDYTFVPRNVGEYDIPAAEFVYFDTQKRDYVTLHTSPIHLNVEKGKRSKEDVEAELAMRNSDIRDIHTGSASIVKREGLAASSNWIGSFRYFGELFIFIVGLSVILRRLRKRLSRNADVAATRGRKARKKANRHLRSAEQALSAGDHNAFYAALSQALRGYFADKLTRDAAALTNDVILSALSERQIDAELIEQTRRLLEDCDFARFAPVADASQREQDFSRASSLINQLEDQFKS